MQIRKSVLITSLCTSLICLFLGYRFEKWRSEAKYEEKVVMIETREVDFRLKILDSLYNNEPAQATHALESQLNLDVLLVAPTPLYQNQLDEGSTYIIKLIKEHRVKHPFTDANHPNIDQMVKEALQSAM
jgi:hypothetical protein